MAYGIFRVNKELTAILDIEAVKLCPELAMLTDDQVMYIILAYDIIDSPYRLKQLDERKRVAKERIFGDKEDPEKFQDVIVKKQNDILRTGLSEREIDYAIKYLKLKEDYGINSLENLGTILIDWCRLTGNPENYFKVMKRMKTIETGRVNELMREIIKTDNLSFCLMKPEE